MKFLFFLLLPFSTYAGVTQLSEAPMKKHEKGAEIRFLSEGSKAAFMGHLTVPANGKVPRHKDPTEEYIYVLQGSGTVWIDGKSHKVKKGSAIYMPANVEVSFENGPEPLKALQFFAPKGPDKKYDKW